MRSRPGAENFELRTPPLEPQPSGSADAGGELRVLLKASENWPKLSGLFVYHRYAVPKHGLVQGPETGEVDNARVVHHTMVAQPQFHLSLSIETVPLGCISLPHKFACTGELLSNNSPCVRSYRGYEIDAAWRQLAWMKPICLKTG